MKNIAVVLLAFLFVACAQLDSLIPDALKSKLQMAQNSSKETREGLYVIEIHGDWCKTCDKIAAPIQSLKSYFQNQPNVDFLVFDQTNPKTLNQSLNLAKQHGLGNLFEHQRHTGEVLFVDKATKKVLTRVYAVTSADKYKDIAQKLLAGKSVPSILARRRQYDLSKPDLDEVEKADLLVIDIHHDMCGGCAITAPVFEEVAKKYRRKKQVCFMTFDLTNPQTIDQTRNLARASGLEYIYNNHKHTGEVLFVNADSKNILGRLTLETNKNKYHDLIKQYRKQIDA